VLEPVGYPGNAEMLGEAGLFRIRVPFELLDHEVLLKVYRGDQQVDVLSIFLEPGKVKRFGDKYIYTISSHVLPGRCEDLSGNPDAAIAFRDQLRMQGTPAPTQAGFGVSKPALSGIVAALLGAGVYAAQAAGAGADDLKNQINGGPDFPVPPGELSVYSQFSSAPMLGRTTTTFRNYGQAATWNPSLLVHTTGNYLSASGGVRNEWQAGGSYRLPWTSESVPFYLPRVLSASFLGVYWEDTDLGEPGFALESLEQSVDESSLTVGLGFQASEAVALGVNFRHDEQSFGTVATVGNDGIVKSSAQNVVDTRATDSRNDLDLGLTWDAHEELRVAVTAYSIGGSEALDADREEVPLSRAVVGGSWIRDRVQLGAEFGMNPGDLNVALGVSYRAHRLLSLDLAGSSRWETIQVGADFTPGPVTGTFRIRWDDREEGAVHLGVGGAW
jgi:hypothetical protein